MVSMTGMVKLCDSMLLLQAVWRGQRRILELYILMYLFCLFTNETRLEHYFGATAKSWTSSGVNAWGNPPSGDEAIMEAEVAGVPEGIEAIPATAAVDTGPDITAWGGVRNPEGLELTDA